jgi:hypothetical protein
MAAPFVTGVAALLAAANPAYDWRAIRNLLLAGGNTLPALANTVTSKRLNAYGALTCSNSPIASRLQPTSNIVSGAAGTPLTLAYLNINCALPNGGEHVTVSPGGSTIELLDDGKGADQAAGDGIYSGQWTPPTTGSYALSFPGGDQVAVEVLNSYVPAEVAPANYNYLTIAGTNLNLGDDSVAAVTSPFPIQFGDGSFSTLYISSNGTISFTDVFGDYSEILPQYPPPFTLVQPWWEDLYPVSNTDHNVFWDVIGSAPNRQLVVEWRDVQLYECREDTTATIKFQVVFTEGSSEVLYNYANTTFGAGCVTNTFEDNGGGATIGLQVAPGNDSVWSFYTQSVTSGMGLLWKTATTAPPANPVPSLTSMSPASANWGGPDFWLTVNGSGFVQQTRITFGGYFCYTQYINSSQVMALVPSSYLLYSPGTTYVWVQNPSPGGGWSTNTLDFTVNYPTPVVTAVSPTSVVAGGFGFLLEVDGQGFQLGTTVLWNGQSRQVYMDGTTRMYAGILMSDIATPGTAQVTVSNPSPGGGTSNPVTVTIAPATQSSAASVLATQSPGGTNAAAGINSTAALSKFIPRFLGWKLASRLGPDYLKHFQRQAAGAAHHAATSVTPNLGGPTPGARSLAQGLSPSLLPGFASNETLPVDFLPSAVVAGDFNGDGKMDWAVASGGANTIWVYLGNGDGTARPPTIIPLNGQSPVAMVAADLRGVGKLDLIVAEADSEQVSVLLGNGDGTFGPETPYPVPGAPLWLLVDHFRKSGPMDIVAALANTDGNGEFTLLPGDGTGKFGPSVFEDPPIPYAYWLADYMVEADLNGDGLPDLIVNDQGAGPLPQPGVFAYLNNGDGTFKVSQPFVDTSGVTSLAVADFNGDGCIDLVDVNLGGLANLFLGNCDGTFKNDLTNTPKFGIGELPVAAVAADVNGDGHPDLITTGADLVEALGIDGDGQQSGSLVSVLLGDGKGGFQTARVYRSQPSMYSVAVADVNGDGHPDILTASQDADLISVLLNDGSGGFGLLNGAYNGYQNGSSITGGMNDGLFGARLLDLNGDGNADFAVLEMPWTIAVPYTLDVLLGNGGGHFATQKRSPVLDSSLTIGDYAFGDFRGTGRPDFVAVGSQFSMGTSYLAFAKNNGDATFTALPLTHPSGAQGFIGVGDFNGDGKLDLLVVGQNLTVFNGNGDGTFTPGYTTTLNFPSSLNQVFVGDFNGDKKLDVLVRIGSTTEGRQGDNVYEFLGKGDGTFFPPTVVIPDCGAIAVGDLNKDGRPDVVELAEGLAKGPELLPTEYHVYLAQPDGSFNLTNTYQAYAGLNSPNFGPVLADINGDGNLDIPVLQLYPVSGDFVGTWAYLQVLLGNGDGTFTPSYTTYDFHQGWVPQYWGDMNGDGKADLVELDGYPNSAHVIPAISGPALQVSLVSYPIADSQGTVRINLALTSTSDTAVQLSASDSALTLPSSATIPAGNPSVDVPFQIGSNFNPNHVFTITAALGTQTAVAYGWKANPATPPGFTLGLNNKSYGIAASETTPDYGVYVNEINGYATTVQLSCSGLPVWAACQFGTPTIEMPPGNFANSTLVVTTTSAAPIGTYNFNVIATDGVVTDQMAATLQIGDFAITITPSVETVAPSVSATYMIGTTSINGFGGYIQGGITGLPPGAIIGLGGVPGQAGGPPQQTIIETSSVAAGSYTFTVTATSGPLTHTATATLVVLAAPGITSSIAPTSATVTAGQSTNFGITLNSQDGATGTVGFQCAGLPSGTACTFVPVAPTLPANGSVSDTLTVLVISSVAAGSYPFTVSATSGSLSTSVNATLVVQPPPSLSGSMSPASATLSVGQSTNFAITLNSQNGATGAVTLQCMNLPSGTTCSFNPAAPMLPANGTVSDTLTVQVNSMPAASAPRILAPWPFPTDHVGAMRLFFLMLVLGLALTVRTWPRRRRLVASLVVLGSIGLLFLASASCGGGGSGGGSGGSPSPPAPVVVTIPVQANGAGVATTQSIGTLTLTVN